MITIKDQEQCPRNVKEVIKLIASVLPMHCDDIEGKTLYDFIFNDEADFKLMPSGDVISNKLFSRVILDNCREWGLNIFKPFGQTISVTMTEKSIAPPKTIGVSLTKKE